VPTQTQTEVGYYTLPVILSFDGVEKNVNSKLGKLFGNVGKNASKSLAENTQADLKRAGDAYTKLRDRAADALGKVRVEEEKLAKARASGKQDQVVAAEERLNKTRRDAKRLNREAAASFEEVTAAQKRLADSASKTSSGLGGLLSKLGSLGGAAKTGGAEAATGFVGGFGGPIAALGTKAGPIGLALAATAGLGLAAGKLLGDQVMAGIGQLKEEAGVAAKLGLTAEQIKPLARSAAAAYAANFGDSISGNLDTIRAAVQGGILDPNANQADVEKIVAQLTTVAEVTGEGIPAAVRTAQQAVRTGLAQDVTGAFDLIVKAQQQGLNVSEDLFDTINEYGTQFRKLGLDGPEALGLIAQAVKGGARDTDTAADALKEFSIRAIDGSKLTGQAYHDLGLSFKGTTEAFAAGGDTAKATFQEVVNRIAAVEDPAKRAQIQVALFGTKAEDLGNAVNTMDLSTAVSQFGQVEGAAAKAAETLGGGAAGSIEQAKRNIEVAIDGMQKGLAQAFGPALEKVAAWVIKNQDKIVGFFTGVGHAAITASEFVVTSLGDIVSGLGQLISPLGDAYGLFLKFKALLAEDRGDEEEAKKLREQAEAAFGWGEGLTAAGDAMKAFDATEYHKALDDAAVKANTAATATDGLTTSLDQLRKQQFFEAFGKPMPAGSGAAASGAVGAGSTRTGSNAGLTQTSINAKAAIESQFPDISTIGGYRPDPNYPNEHPAGKALDVMIPNWNTPAGKARGDEIAKYLLSNAGALGIDYVLWQQRQWNPDGTSSPMRDLKNATDNHMDHVHVHTEGTPQLPGAVPPKPPALTTSLGGTTSVPGATAMPSAVASTPGLSSAIDTSKLYDAAPPMLTNAYGPGYEPGIGTPGVNDYGNPGYYRVDPRQLRDAQRASDNAQRAITEADAAAQAARDARAALNDTPFVTPTEIAGADKAVRDAEYAASEARLDAANAAEDAAKAAKGDFTEAKKAPKKAKGDSNLGELGSIASSFLKDTFGIGSFLPALDNLMPLQMADTIFGAFDWSTMGFSPEAQAAKAAAQGTSSSAFGIPDIAAPPMPQDGMHGGSGGAPGPVNMITVDQSQNFNNSPVGSDPAAVEKARQSNINRAPRLPIGMGG